MSWMLLRWFVPTRVLFRHAWALSTTDAVVSQDVLGLYKNSSEDIGRDHPSSNLCLFFMTLICLGEVERAIDSQQRSAFQEVQTLFALR